MRAGFIPARPRTEGIHHGSAGQQTRPSHGRIRETGPHRPGRNTAPHAQMAQKPGARRDAARHAHRLRGVRADQRPRRTRGPLDGLAAAGRRPAYGHVRNRTGAIVTIIS